MNTGFMIITNNPLVKEKLGEDYHVEYEELSYEDTLKKVQKMIFQGYRLLTHPLSGSVKPNETPYKSVMLSETPEGLDAQAMQIIASAIQACGKFQFKSDLYKPQVDADFQLVDYTLISSALPAAESWRSQKAVEVHAVWCTFEHTTNTFKKGGNLQ